MDILEAIATLDELEWGKYGPSPSMGQAGEIFAPVAVWRFKTADARRDGLILDVVKAFQGRIEWEMYRGGRNWVIAPRLVRRFREEGKFRTPGQAKEMLAKEHPEVGRAGHLDARELVELIRKLAASQSRKDS